MLLRCGGYFLIARVQLRDDYEGIGRKMMASELNKGFNL